MARHSLSQYLKLSQYLGAILSSKYPSETNSLWCCCPFRCIFCCRFHILVELAACFLELGNRRGVFACVQRGNPTVRRFSTCKRRWSDVHTTPKVRESKRHNWKERQKLWRHRLALTWPWMVVNNQRWPDGWWKWKKQPDHDGMNEPFGFFVVGWAENSCGVVSSINLEQLLLLSLPRHWAKSNNKSAFRPD